MKDEYPHHISIEYGTYEGNLSDNMEWYARIEDEDINETYYVTDSQFGAGMWHFDTSFEYNEKRDQTTVYFDFRFRTESDLVAFRIML